MREDAMTPRNKRTGVGQFCVGFLREFLQNSSVHGLRHMLVERSHPLELTLWLGIMAVSVLSSYLLIASSWNRYNENPTVVSVEKDYRAWNVTHPAFTLCYLDRLNKTKAEAYVEQTWNVNASSPKGVYYMNYLNAVANISFDTMHRFRDFAGDTQLQKIDMEKLALHLQVDMNHRFSNKLELQVQYAVLSEHGFCYTTESAIGHNFPANVSDLSRAEPSFRTLKSCFQQTYCTSAVPVTSIYSFMYAVHSPHDVVDANTHMIHVPIFHGHFGVYEYVTYVAAPAIGQLTPKQRRCRFPDEVAGTGLRLYSYNLCQMECKKRRAIQLCRCAPFFYKRIGALDEFRVCDATGLKCLSHLIVQLYNASCGCLPLCEDVHYNLDLLDIVNILKTVSQGGIGDAKSAKAEWRILKLTKYRYMRDVVFSFTDLLVSFGGIAALFLGCSLLSGVELVYFFTIRLVYQLIRLRQNN